MKKVLLCALVLAGLSLVAAAQPAIPENVVYSQRASVTITYGGPTRAEGRSYNFTPIFLVYPDGKLDKAGAEALFSAATPGSMENVPAVTLEDEDFDENGTVDILTILVKAGLEKSKSDARRDVKQGGVTVDGEKVTDFKTVYKREDLADGKLVKRGKKNFKLVKS